MSEGRQFAITLEQLSGLEFKVKWDWDTAPPLLLDEPEPVGTMHGPNAARLLAAAIGNCLTASLAFCLQRARTDVGGLVTQVTGTIVRNERGRLRVGGYDVRIQLPAGVERTKAGLERCLGVFEDYCIVTSSVRQGISVRVQVIGPTGETVFETEDQ